ncbi:MAG: nucleotidyltransferase domain-containing protein [Bacteroidota bacterium]
MKLTIEQLKSQGLILLESVAGSRAYGTATPQSDTDLRGVFVLPPELFYRLEYIPQVANESNDIVYYEIRRFTELLLKNNPTILELLAMPEDCIQHRDPLMDHFRTEDILSQLCKDSFAGYARAQIRKAYGLNKKILNPMDKVRKGILAFCWVVEGQGAVSVEEWLAARGWKQEDCGLVNIPHMREIYGLFHAGEQAREVGFKGIAQKADSNNISLSSIPKGMPRDAVMAFNKDGYTRYCKDYKAYWDWVGDRNEARYENTLEHGKNYDSKNMMHTFRLIDMAVEIARDRAINVRRPNRDYLLKIRKGEFAYQELVDEANARLAGMDQLYAESELPAAPDPEVLNRALVEAREAFYARQR